MSVLHCDVCGTSGGLTVLRPCVMRGA
ncbi:hypothetical protein [Hyphomicrobium sp.]